MRNKTTGNSKKHGSGINRQAYQHAPAHDDAEAHMTYATSYPLAAYVVFETDVLLTYGAVPLTGNFGTSLRVSGHSPEFTNHGTAAGFNTDQNDFSTKT